MFGKVEERKGHLLEEIHAIDLMEEYEGLDDHDCRGCCLLQEEFFKKLLQEEIKWRQRSRNKWLDEGDRNT